jgi:hypothetical protein
VFWGNRGRISFEDGGSLLQSSWDVKDIGGHGTVAAWYRCHRREPIVKQVEENGDPKAATVSNSTWFSAVHMLCTHGQNPVLQPGQRHHSADYGFRPFVRQALTVETRQQRFANTV